MGDQRKTPSTYLNFRCMSEEGSGCPCPDLPISNHRVGNLQHHGNDVSLRKEILPMQKDFGIVPILVVKRVYKIEEGDRIRSPHLRREANESTPTCRPRGAPGRPFDEKIAGI